MEDLRPRDKGRQGALRSLQPRIKTKDQLPQAQTQIAEGTRRREGKIGSHQEMPTEDGDRVSRAASARSAHVLSRRSHPQKKGRVSHPRRNRVILRQKGQGGPGQSRSRPRQSRQKIAGKVQNAKGNLTKRSRSTGAGSQHQIR